LPLDKHEFLCYSDMTITNGE